MCIWMNTDMGTGLLGLFGLKGVLYLSFSLFYQMFILSLIAKNHHSTFSHLALVMYLNSAINKSDPRY